MWCSGKCTSQARLDGKTAIITGSNSGIGQYNVLDFYRRGCRVIMACRNLQKAEEARADILKKVNDQQNLGEIVVRQLDLSSLESVRSFADQIMREEPQINLLINNAGVMMCPPSKTVDGFEMQFGTNHLGHFLLTSLLLPRIIQSAPARIVTVSSVAYQMGKIDFDDLNWEKRSYSSIKAYGQSKLANILFSSELASRLAGKGVTVYTLHPGVVKTDLDRHMGDTYFSGLTTLYKIFVGTFSKTPEQGAQTQIYCAVDEKAGEETGLYYEDCKVKALTTSQAKDKAIAAKLWEESANLVKLGNFDPFTST